MGFVVQRDLNWHSSLARPRQQVRAFWLFKAGARLRLPLSSDLLRTARESIADVIVNIVCRGSSILAVPFLTFGRGLSSAKAMVFSNTIFLMIFPLPLRWSLLFVPL